MPWVFASGTPRLSPNETASAGRLLWSLQMLWVVIGAGGDDCGLAVGTRERPWNGLLQRDTVPYLTYKC